MTFEQPDHETFSALELGYEVAQRGGTCGAVLNAANEVAVAAFLDERIKFGDIPRLIQDACDAHRPQPASSIEAVLGADQWARGWVGNQLGKERTLKTHSS